MADLGIGIVRVNGTLADIADDAETESLRWNVHSHLLGDEMRRDTADDMGTSTVLVLVKLGLRARVRWLECFRLHFSFTGYRKIGVESVRSSGKKFSREKVFR